MGQSWGSPRTRYCDPIPGLTLCSDSGLGTSESKVRHCSNNRIAPEFPHIKCSSEQFLWRQDRLGFDSGFRDVPIESQTFLKRKGLNRRRRKSTSLYARGESAKYFGGFLETELERIHPKQPRLIVIEIHE